MQIAEANKKERIAKQEYAGIIQQVCKTGARMGSLLSPYAARRNKSQEDASRYKQL